MLTFSMILCYSSYQAKLQLFKTQLEFALLATIANIDLIIVMLPFIRMEISQGIQIWYQKIDFIWWRIFARLGPNELKDDSVHLHGT